MVGVGCYLDPILKQYSSGKNWGFIVLGEGRWWDTGSVRGTCRQQ